MDIRRRIAGRRISVIRNSASHSAAAADCRAATTAPRAFARTSSPDVPAAWEPGGCDRGHGRRCLGHDEPAAITHRSSHVKGAVS